MKKGLGKKITQKKKPNLDPCCWGYLKKSTNRSFRSRWTAVGSPHSSLMTLVIVLMNQAPSSTLVNLLPVSAVKNIFTTLFFKVFTIRSVTEN